METTQKLLQLVNKIHNDESGVAATEYTIVFTLFAFGGVIGMMGSAAYIKSYRDFLVWWMANPAV